MLMMDWHVDERSGTLRIDLNEGPSPSRDEVEGLLRQLAPVLRGDTVRRVSVNGRRVLRRRNLTVDDVALPIRYAVAQRRAVENWSSLWRTRSAS